MVVMIAFAMLVWPKIGQLFGGKCAGAPRATDTAFEIADVA
jgi:hypothetical protein